MNTFIKRPAVLFIGAIVMFLFILLSYSYESSGVTHAATEAKRIIDICHSASDRPACYEAETPALYPKWTVPEIFAVIRELRLQDPSYQFCHVLAHNLGNRVVAEDPTKWVDAIMLNPADGLCSNGYIHGVTTGRFRAEVLDRETIEKYLPDFARACEARGDWTPSDLDRAICYHGMGHLYDFITDADLPLARELCYRTTPEGYGRVCVEGVYMQLFQPLEPDDFALIERLPVKPVPSNVRSFCADQKIPEAIGACLRESWPLWSDGIRDGSYAKTFCSGHPNTDETNKCYESVSAIIARTALDDSEKAIRACGRLPEDRQSACYAIGAQAVIEENRSEGARAIEFCASVADKARAFCLENLSRRARFMFGSNDTARRAFCELLPPEVQKPCNE